VSDLKLELRQLSYSRSPSGYGHGRVWSRGRGTQPESMAPHIRLTRCLEGQCCEPLSSSSSSSIIIITSQRVSHRVQQSAHHQSNQAKTSMCTITRKFQIPEKQDSVITRPRNQRSPMTSPYDRRQRAQTLIPSQSHHSRHHGLLLVASLVHPLPTVTLVLRPY
jgi:hypothetical protein